MLWAPHAVISPAMLRFGLSLAAIVFVLDQLTKWLVLVPGRFSPQGCLEAGFGCRFIELSPIFDLQMVWNRGVSFGLLRADSDVTRWGLVVMSLVISGVFLWWLRTAERRITAISLGLVIGGALGNVIDRIRFGAVADFFDFSGMGFVWVFNVADAAITVGAIILAVDMIFFTESEPGQPPPWARLKAFARRKLGRSDAPPGAGG